MTDKQKKEVKTMYNDGWNPEDISEELGYDETEVMEYCAEILQAYDKENNALAD